MDPRCANGAAKMKAMAAKDRAARAARGGVMKGVARPGAKKGAKAMAAVKVKTTAKKPEAKAANPPLAMKAVPKAMRTAKAATPRR